jgi:hypothetical protein
VPLGLDGADLVVAAGVRGDVGHCRGGDAGPGGIASRRNHVERYPGDRAEPGSVESNSQTLTARAEQGQADTGGCRTVEPGLCSIALLNDATPLTMCPPVSCRKSPTSSSQLDFPAPERAAQSAAHHASNRTHLIACSRHLSLSRRRQQRGAIRVTDSQIREATACFAADP